MTSRDLPQTDAGSRRAVVTAVIPARGGSKGVPGKNVQPVGGTPLLARTISAASSVPAIGRVVVSTDDDTIAAVAAAAGADVIRRPAALSGDTASSEAALLHALDALETEGALPDVTVFLQTTSPFLDPSDLAAAVERVTGDEADSVLSVVSSHAFLWREGDDGAEGVNHSSSVRLRRQEIEPEYRETGAFYVFDTAGFRTARHRFFGRIALQTVPEIQAIEIDTPDDLALARALAGIVDPTLPGVSDEPGPGEIAAVVTDFDGVHTDDTAIIGVDGAEFVRVSRSDGHGVKRLREAGIPVLILSAEAHPVVAARAAKLQVDVLHGVDDKAAALREWAERVDVPLSAIAYLGNDLADLPPLRLVGWPLAVADAVPAVRELARIVLARPGGHGAVRELSDLVLGPEPQNLQREGEVHVSTHR